MEALVVATFQLGHNVYRFLGDSETWAARFEVTASAFVAVMLLLRLLLVDSLAGNFFVGLVLVFASNSSNFYFTLGRSLTLWALAIVDTSDGNMPAALVVFYAAVAFAAMLHTQTHLHE